MSLREDLETMQYYSRRGLLKEHLEGTTTEKQRAGYRSWRETAAEDDRLPSHILHWRASDAYR